MAAIEKSKVPFTPDTVAALFGRADAREAVRELAQQLEMADIASGITPPVPCPVGDVLDAFRASSHPTGRDWSDRTRAEMRRYARILSKHLRRKHLLYMPIDRIADRDWEDWILAPRLDGETASASTVNVRNAFVANLLIFAHREGWLPVRGRKVVPNMKTATPPHYGLEEGEFEALLEGAARGRHPDRDRMLLLVLKTTGMRAAELAGFRWDSMFEYKGRRFARVCGKGGKVRQVAVLPKVDGMLDAYRSSFLSRDSRSPFVFPGVDGSRMAEANIRRILAECAKRGHIQPHPWREGLPHPHTLRHTYALDLVKAGVELPFVQEALGHANLATTSIYTRPSPQEAAMQINARHPFADLEITQFLSIRPEPGEPR